MEEEPKKQEGIRSVCEPVVNPSRPAGSSSERHSCVCVIQREGVLVGVCVCVCVCVG